MAYALEPGLPSIMGKGGTLSEKIYLVRVTEVEIKILEITEIPSFGSGLYDVSENTQISRMPCPWV